MKTVINICSTDWNYRKGGVAAYNLELNKALNNRKVRVINLAVGKRGESSFSNIYYSSTSDNIFVKNFLLLITLVKLIFIVSRIDSRFKIFVHNIPVTFFSLPIISLFRDRFFYFFHGPAYLEYKQENKSYLLVFIIYVLEYIYYKIPSKIIFLSDAFQNIYKEKFTKPSGQTLHKVPYGVNNVSLNRKIKNKNNVKQLISVRRLQKRMGLDLLIKAFNCEVIRNSNIHLNIVGKGPEKKNLIKLVTDNNLQNKITIHGYLSDEELDELFKQCDFSIMPTRSLEGFGISIFDSLRRGIPVLVTNVGGMPEIIGSLNNDLIISRPTIKEIRNKLIKLINEEIEIPSEKQCIEFLKDEYNYQKTFYKLYEITFNDR